MGTSGIVIKMIPHFAWLECFWGLTAVGMSFVDVNANPLLTDIADYRHKGFTARILATSNSGVSIGNIIGPILGGKKCDTKQEQRR